MEERADRKSDGFVVAEVDLELLAERFRVLGEPMRLRLLSCLRDGEKSVTELVEATGTSQANVSQHLALLYRHGLVARRKEGTFSYYRIDDPLLFELCEMVCHSIETELERRRRALSPHPVS